MASPGRSGATFCRKMLASFEMVYFVCKDVVGYLLSSTTTPCPTSTARHFLKLPRSPAASRHVDPKSKQTSLDKTRAESGWHGRVQLKRYLCWSRIERRRRDISSAGYLEVVEVVVVSGRPSFRTTFSDAAVPRPDTGRIPDLESLSNESGW